MALMTDLWRECSSPISDFRVSSTVSMRKRLRSMTLSARGIQIVPHVASDAGDEVQATPPEFVEQLAADVALVGVELARKMAGHLVQHGAVGGVAGGDLQRHDLALWLITKCSLRP